MRFAAREVAVLITTQTLFVFGRIIARQLTKIGSLDQIVEQFAAFRDPLFHKVKRLGGYVYPDPLSLVFVSCDAVRGTSAERIQDNITVIR